ncbi:aminotransferase class I/II-fold pyridoxal phosphate-dependent enzyme, partial [Roseibium sp.]|uniref:aminotransferase class I/II-fold pyridoxal phosphate-dependent enzyme n=1 Tax=Roseibium sp. TaxID=1936156 RepID=UPI003D13DC69
AATAVVPVNTPDYAGCFESGHALAVEAIIDTLVPESRRAGRRRRQVNVLASSMLTPGDIEALREWLEAFDLRAVVLPDIGDALDGHLTEQAFSPLTLGGTPRAEIEKLVTGLAAFPDVAVMSDEIYAQMTYDGMEHVSLLGFEELRDRLILLDGWSKTYAMTGWRMGFSLWPDGLIDKARKLAVNAWSCVNAPAQYGGLAALTGPQDEVASMVAEFDARRRVIVDGLNAIDGISCRTPLGAFYAYPNIGKTGWKAKALASALLEEAGVAVIGGPDFGVLGEGYIRLSYANSTANIKAALERIERFLQTSK